MEKLCCHVTISPKIIVKTGSFVEQFHCAHQDVHNENSNMQHGVSINRKKTRNVVC